MKKAEMIWYLILSERASAQRNISLRRYCKILWTVTVLDQSRCFEDESSPCVIDIIATFSSRPGSV